MNKITIISIFDKNEDFIKLQYESIKKHIKGDYEYLIFDNGSTEEQSNVIKKICFDLNIKCISIKPLYGNPSNIAGEALNQAFLHLSNKIVFKMDSDMFFISNINLSEICNNNDLFYIETHNQFIWSGVFSLNLNKIKDLNLDFRPNVIPNTDTFGQSKLLTENETYTRKKMFLYSIFDETHNVITGSINNDCFIKLNNQEILEIENNRYEEINNNLINKYYEIYNKVIDFNFPKPYNIDIITINNIDTIIHFKSSNHDNMYKDLEYTKNKKNSLIQILKHN
jgi:hypothetical protein